MTGADALIAAAIAVVCAGALAFRLVFWGLFDNGEDEWPA